MRIAIFHNFMDNIGGAELVTLTLAKELNADVYSTVVNQKMIEKLGFKIRVRSIGWVPKNAPLRQQITAYRFKHLKLKKDYDFYIISGDWAATAAYNHKPNLWIIYSPPRELWDLYRHTRDVHVSWWGKWLFDFWVWYNRKLSRKNLGEITSMVAISKNVQNRVKKYFNVTIPFIYPPTETKKFYYNKNGNFWLSVNRLITHKRIELQLEAFRKMPREKLIIVGSYEKSTHFKAYANKIIKNAPPNVVIKSWIDANELRDLYANCKGFITTSIDEDYGMNVVEAMASGKPVIAPNNGGYKETVIHDKTGKLINNINALKIAEAVKSIGKHPKSFKHACIQRSAEFDTSVFIKFIKKTIQNDLLSR